MGLFDAIDRLLEPITKKIFSSELGKSIKPLSSEELFEDHLYLDDKLSNSDMRGTRYYSSYYDD